MNCELKDEKFDMNNLTVKQRVVFKPALTFLQIGATFYLSELVKPVILPIFLLSVAIVLIVVLRARKQPGEYSAERSPEQMLVAVQAEEAFTKPAGFTRS